MLIEADQICILINLFFYWLNLITLEKKTEMKKYNIKVQKDMQKRRKGKWQLFIVKEKKS